ncbi:oxidoreductase [Marmoricola endophyticus]|nr:oxidoreductase [Marmoricola endophyticus]
MASTYAIGSYTVHRVGFGAMQLPGPGVMGPPKDHDQAIAVLRRAVEAGVDHIDTSDFYGPYVSNDLIREALHPYDEKLALVSKVGAFRDDEGNWLPGQTPAQLRQGVEDNLARLGVERLAAVNLRRMDEHEGAEQVPLEDQLAEMAALRDEGKIAGIGISTVPLEMVKQAHESVGLVTVQNAFGLTNQEDLATLEYCRDQGISYAPYFPLGSAFDGIPKVVDQPAVQRVAERVGATAAQVGLAWLLAKADNVLLIPGTSSLAHLEENLAVADVQLGDDDLAELA